MERSPPAIDLFIFAALCNTLEGKALVQDGFAVGWCGDGRFYCDNPSVSFADSSLYTREPWGAAAPVGGFGCRVGSGRFLSPSQKSKIFDSPAGPAPLLSALRTFSPLTGKSALVRGGLWVRCEAGGAEVERRFLRCFAATPHPSAALTPNELWSDRHRRSTYLYSLRSATPSRGRLWCGAKPGVRQRIGRRQKDFEHGRSPYHNL